MKGFTQEHTIPAPPSAVFAVLSDVEGTKQWRPELRDIRPISEGPLAKGHKWVETLQTKGGPFVATVECTEFEPERALAVRSANRKAEVLVRFGLEQVDGGTKVRAEQKGRLKGPLFLFSGRLVKEMQETDKDLLQRLEARVLAKPAKGGKAAPAKAEAKAVAKEGKGAKAAKAESSKAAKAEPAKVVAKASPKRKGTSKAK